MKPTTYDQVMDVFAWFDCDTYDYVYHNRIAKLDGEKRIAIMLPDIIDEAEELLAAQAQTPYAHIAELIRQQWNAPRHNYAAAGVNKMRYIWWNIIDYLECFDDFMLDEASCIMDYYCEDLCYNDDIISHLFPVLIARMAEPEDGEDAKDIDQIALQLLA